ncbi:MAG: thioredoxin domain-containing protein, partial [Acidobacteriota bacterium]|nr:thioredoxin domain-containing protein [Acidobacteriota bacterium]
SRRPRRPRRPQTARAQAPARPAATPTPAPAAKPDDCGCEAEALPDVFAVVNGVKITPAEIDAQIKDTVQQLEQEVTEMRRHQLDVEINRLLLDAEAKRRGKTTDQLLDEEINSKVAEPTDMDARNFYNQNREKINADFAAVKDQIVAYLRQQRQDEQAKRFADQLRAAAQVKLNVAEAAPPSTPADRARVFATVNGVNITSAMIEDAIRPFVYDTQRKVYQLRKQQLDQRINDLLLNAEAQKRQATPQAVLEAEVTAKVPVVTEAQARKFYDENKERINGEFAAIKDQIVQYLTEQEQQKLTGDFAERLRRAATIQTFLREPAAPVYQISTDDQPARGEASAPVTLIEFTDYQCPSCAAMQPILERVMTEYAGRVRLVVRDFPLQMHANARKAAEAAEAARAQGKYWEYTALLFANQSALDAPQLKEYATRVGLDRAKFDAALDAGQLAQKVQSDLNDGNRLGVHATPTIFVNGRPLEDNSYEALKAMIDAALKEKGRG